jgi:hypothetical protein
MMPGLSVDAKAWYKLVMMVGSEIKENGGGSEFQV